MGRQRKYEWIEARALIERPGDERLIARPPDGEDTPWEFPGGQVEPHESPEQALRRLCRQRLGIEIELRIGQPPFIGYVENQAIVYRYYLCAVRTGEAAALGYGEIRWVKLPQLREYIFNEPAQKVVDWLLEG